jgi:electron transfer flavoprotein alpha subunit
MAGNIWVLAEHWRGEISDITFECLALGREVASALGVKLEVLLMGHSVEPLAAELGVADNAIVIDHPALEVLVPDAYAAALAQAMRAREPMTVLVPLTNVTMGVGTLAGAALGCPVVNFCKNLRVNDGRLEVSVVLYGGKMEAVVTPASSPSVLGVWPGARNPEQGKSATAPPVEDFAVTLADRQPVVFRRYLEPEAGDVDITQKEALVAVGRGIGGQENLELAEELATALDGAVCGSRPVIDQGWLPLSRQVGKSGLTVKPKLYIAAGISGAPEHVEGIKDSELIIAINSDERAPIFNVAHYGVVGDALELLPAITEQVRATKG